jgi:hypothetical protein
MYSESELLYDWRFTANQFVLATSQLRLSTGIFFPPQLNSCGYSPYVTSSLRRGWVCRLQLLLVLASAVILRSESRGTHDNILLSQIRDSTQPGRSGRRIYIPPGRGWLGYTPLHWVPFSSLPTTCRATVEVFDPASTWDTSHILRYKVINLNIINVPTSKLFYVGYVRFCQKCSRSVGS